MANQESARLQINGGAAEWDEAWRRVRLGDTVIASKPGVRPVQFDVAVRTGGDGFGPVQIAGEYTGLYTEPCALEIIKPSTAPRKA